MKGSKVATVQPKATLETSKQNKVFQKIKYIPNKNEGNNNAVKAYYK